MFVLKVVLIIFLLLVLWLLWKYVLLIFAKRNADNAFDKFFGNIKEYNINVREVLSAGGDFISPDSEKVSKTLEFIEKLNGFSIEKDGNERIIGYENAILNNVKDLIKITENIEYKPEIIEKYICAGKKFDAEKNVYNASAKTLKHYVDVFPTSFYARLKNIKFFDYIV